MTDDSKGPELTDAELEAIERRAEAATPGVFIAESRTDVPALCSLVRQQRARIAELETAWSTALGWHSQGTAAIARAERAEARVAELEAAADLVGEAVIEQREAMRVQRDRAEAACAQMRAVIEEGVAEKHCVPNPVGACISRRLCKHAPEAQSMLALLAATDVGAGYVDPQTHAGVVARAELAERDLAYERAKVAIAVESGNDLRAQLAVVTKELDEARDQLRDLEERRDRKATRERNEALETLELLKGTPLGRVLLLEAVAVDGRATVKADATRLRHGRAPAAECKLERSLAALDAYDAREREK